MDENEKEQEEKRKDRIKKEKQAREEFGVEVGEDCTKYGEFVSSYFAWIPLPEQKEKAKQLQDMTDISKKKK